MLDGSYTGMQASVADFLNRQDLSASIPDFITIGEADLNRKLAVRQMMALTTLNATSGVVALPPDFVSPIILANPVTGLPMDQMSPDAFTLNAAIFGNGSYLNGPSNFAIIGANANFYPAPTSAVAIPMTYVQRLPPLAANASGNWLSLSSPDAYLYGALTAAAPYLQDDDRVEVWTALYQNAVDGIQDADKRQYGSRLTPQPTLTQIV